MRVGTDIVEIDRVQALMNRHSETLCGRIFTLKEWVYCMKKTRPVASLAVRIAAKEAVAKAFGVGFGIYLKWISVEIITDALDAPSVHLDALGQKLMKKYHAYNVQISLSHCINYALAVAIVE